MHRSSLAALAALCLLLACTAAALAGTGSSSLSAGATLSGKCTTATFSTPVTIPYDPIVANLSSAATGTRVLSLTCSKNTNATIDVDHGANATAVGSYFAPNMIGSLASPDKLSYFVYSDGGYSLLWGTTTSSDGGTSHGSAVTYVALTANATPITLYIRIPANQNVQADTYTDTITATVTY